ncbi:MAG TPA: hypothetical protein PKA00_01340 [Saprospiraceae bacterium]|nr:hypothetical protein [Saprospiraceae bacterium]HMQ81512.1 hypothetical protein [Saprospiraceae bacterium]
MRIAGYIDHPILKITIFQLDNRFAIKFESGLYEQTYKFRLSDNLQTVDDVRQLINESFIAAVLQMIQQMHLLSQQALSKTSPLFDENEFEEII